MRPRLRSYDKNDLNNLLIRFNSEQVLILDDIIMGKIRTDHKNWEIKSIHKLNLNEGDTGQWITALQNCLQQRLISYPNYIFTHPYLYICIYEDKKRFVTENQMLS